METKAIIVPSEHQVGIISSCSLSVNWTSPEPSAFDKNISPSPPSLPLANRILEPSGDQEGSVLDHLGFKVANLKEFLEGWRASGYEVMREFTGVEETPNAYLIAPDQVKIELQEETTLPVKAAAYHIHFFTSEYAELMDWYSDLFLLEPRARGLLRYTADAPGMNLSFSNSRTVRVATRGRSLDHIGFEVDDLEAFVKMLEARGIMFDVPYREVPSIELKIAFFTDPSGVYIELTEGLDKY